MKFCDESCRANRNPRRAVAMSPATRATALLSPDAIPTRFVSTKVMTLVVRGATDAPMPIAINSVGSPGAFSDREDPAKNGVRRRRRPEGKSRAGAGHRGLGGRQGE